VTAEGASHGMCYYPPQGHRLAVDDTRFPTRGVHLSREHVMAGGQSPVSNRSTAHSHGILGAAVGITHYLIPLARKPGA
jgi:hypothetical protein